MFAGGWLADRLGQADRRWYAWLPAIAWAITAPTFAFGLMSSDPWAAWLLLLIPNALNILWLGPVTTAVQHLAPRPMRSTASASFLLINNLIGLGVGPTLIGALSDAFKSHFGTKRFATRPSPSSDSMCSRRSSCSSRQGLRSAWVETTADK